jgi:transposase
MARREQLEQKQKLRQQRYFSEDFRKARVREIERGIATVAEVSKAYGVSDTSVYRWIERYSSMRKKGLRQVVEAKSATQKVLKLKDEVKDLHALLGEKQLRIEFLEKLIELAGEQYGIDLKKSTSAKPFSGSGPTGNAGKRIRNSQV